MMEEAKKRAEVDREVSLNEVAELSILKRRSKGGAYGNHSAHYNHSIVDRRFADLAV